MKKPVSLRDDELKAYAQEHIQYEFDMLIWTAGGLIAVLSQDHKNLVHWMLRNALLNTFSIHARNLIAFLYARTLPRLKESPSDILIEDYVDAALVLKHRTLITTLLETAITKANKQVAHLTKERIDFEKAGKGWDFPQIVIDISKALNSIVPYIPDTRIIPQLKKKLSDPAIIIPAMRIFDVEAPDQTSIGLLLALLTPENFSNPELY